MRSTQAALTFALSAGGMLAPSTSTMIQPPKFSDYPGGTIE
ncbi:hypothetical protein [Rathayibacter sp. PhB127]|nr:hypothetical protein [Rathayibacter sp. PhB127]